MFHVEPGLPAAFPTSELLRYTEVFIAGSYPAARPANELAPPHQFLVIVPILQKESHVLQIAQVFLVPRMRHFRVCHDSSSLPDRACSHVPEYFVNSTIT
jgi:hypothetical protein